MHAAATHQQRSSRSTQSALEHQKTCLKQTKGHGAEEFEVLGWALDSDAIAQAIHKQRANLRAGREDELIP